MLPQTPPRERLEFLDVARGVAALMVVLAHALAQCVPGYLDWSLTHLDLGRVGVVLFLLISGFIIPSSLESGGSLGKFWLRRVFRLYPAYWVAVGLGAAYVALDLPLTLLVRLDDVDVWLANLTMCQGFLGRPHVWGSFWTLQLELVVYAVCSLLFAAGLLRRVGWGFAFALVLLYLPMALYRPLVENKAFFISDVRLLYFAPLVGVVAQRYHAGQVGRRRFYAFVVAQPAVLSLAWGASRWLCPEGVEFVSLGTVLANWCLAYVCFFALLEGRRLRFPAVAAWLGRVSYSVYLFHPLFVVLLAPAMLPAWLYLPAFFGATLAAAALGYYGVELPGIALGRSVERRLLAPVPPRAGGIASAISLDSR